MINTLLETEEGQQKLTASLIPSLRRRGKVDIVEVVSSFPDQKNRKALIRVLYEAAKAAGAEIIDKALERSVRSVLGVPSAEWVEDWIQST
jgi:NADH:ubiquinone oxidoreductase subunit E